MRLGILVGSLFLLLTINVSAQNECTNLGYQVLDSLTAKDSGGTTHQVLCWNPNASGGLLVVPGSPSSGTGTGYSFLAAGTVQAAINSACNGTKPGHVVIPSGTYVGSFTPVSNCTIEGSGMGATIIEAPSTQSSVMISLSSLKNVTLKNFTVDGDCANPWPRTTPTCGGTSSNSNVFDLIQLSGSSQIIIDSVEVRNMQGNGIDLVGGDSYIDIRNSAADYYGQALPATLSGGAGFLVNDGGTSGSTHILFFNDTADNGNEGFLLVPPPGGSVASDIVYESDRSFSNANDGFLVFSGGGNGPAQGLRYINNESYCNGWVAGWTNTACQLYGGVTANGFGLLQNGSQGSGGDGAGFGFNSPVMSQLQVIGNRSHDNYAEGFDHTPQIVAIVNASGTTVTWTSGDSFNQSWKAGQAVRITQDCTPPPPCPAGIYVISTVSGNTITLAAPGAPNYGTSQLVGVGYTRSTLVGNYAYHNGSGNSSSLAGSGFSDISYGSAYTANVSYLNNAAGFIDGTSSLVTHVGDKSFDNNQSNGSERFGFYAHGALGPSYIGVTTDNAGGNNLQKTSVNFDAQTSGAFAESASLCNFGFCNLSITVTDGGTSDAASSGVLRIGPDCFAVGGGTGCINYVGGAGGFTSLIPAQDGTITVH
jgi:hypothetical protein